MGADEGVADEGVADEGVDKLEFADVAAETVELLVEEFELE